MRLPLFSLLLSVLTASADEPKARPEPEYDQVKLSVWLDRLRAKDPADRQKAAAAVRAVVKQSQAAADRIIAAAAESDDPATSIQLLADLGQVAVPALTRAVWDEDPRTRAAAILALGKIGFEARSAAPSLVAALQGPDARLRGLAAEALAGVRARSALPDLVKLLKDPDPRTRARAAAAAIDLGAEAKDVLPALVALLEGDDPDLLPAAEAALIKLGPEAAPAVGALVKLLSRTGLHALVVLRVLSTIGPGAKDAVPAVPGVLRDRPAEEVKLLRVSAAEALWSVARDKQAAALLKAHLAEANPRGADTVAAMLWRIDRSPDAVTRLIELWKGRTDERDRVELALGLGQIGPAAKAAVPELTAALSAKDPDLRLMAVEALGRIGPDAAAALDGLTRLARDPAAGRVRALAAAAALRVRSGEQTVELFREALKAADEEQQIVLASRAAQLGPAAKPLLGDFVARLNDPNPFVRHTAAVAAWQIDRHPDALAALAGLLRSADGIVRVQVVVDIGFAFRADARPAVAALAAALWDPELGVRTAAAEALGRVGPGVATAVPALAALLGGDEYEGLQSAACEALGLIGPAAKDAVPALKRALNHADRHVRVHAALALWLVAKDRSGEGLLKPALGSRNYRERVVAAEALWRMKGEHGGGGAAMDQLVRVVSDVNPRHHPGEGNEQYMAIRALGRIGPPARAAVPALERKLTDVDTALAQTAAEALRAIEPAAAK